MKTFLNRSFSKAIYHPILLNSTLQKHCRNPIIKYNTESTKPPLIFATYQKEGKVYFMPFFLNKNVNFTLSDLYQKIEIIANYSKTIPENMLHFSILTQELVALLHSLKHLIALRHPTPVTLLTDSKCLYHLFNGTVQITCAKTERWCV